MKNLKQLPVLLFSVLTIMAYGQNSKLTKEGAEKAIKEFVTFNNASSTGSRVNISKVLKTEMINQTSDTVATCWVKSTAKVANSESADAKAGNDCIETELNTEFYFKKNADTKWILSGISRSASKIKVNNDYLVQFIEKNRNLSIAAQ